MQDRIKAVMEERKHLEDPGSMEQRKRAANKAADAEVNDMVEKVSCSSHHTSHGACL